MPEDKEAPVYTAEKILLKRVRKGKTEYFIKWKGWAAKYNTWEPEKHILDKLLIEDYNNRNRKQQKSKSLVRNSVNKRAKPVKNRTNNNTTRTRRLQSSSSSDISTSALTSPATNDENKDEETLSTKKLDSERTEVYKLRSKQPEKIETNQKDSSEDSDHEEQQEEKPKEIEKPELDESIKEMLWQPTKISTTTTTITEVTDQSGVTVLIREVSDNPIASNGRTSRILGYGNSGRGGRH